MESALYLLGNPDSIPPSVTFFYDSTIVNGQLIWSWANLEPSETDL